MRSAHGGRYVMRSAHGGRYVLRSTNEIVIKLNSSISMRREFNFITISFSYSALKSHLMTYLFSAASKSVPYDHSLASVST